MDIFELRRYAKSKAMVERAKSDDQVDAWAKTYVGAVLEELARGKG